MMHLNCSIKQLLNTSSKMKKTKSKSNLSFKNNQNEPSLSINRIDMPDKNVQDMKEQSRYQVLSELSLNYSPSNNPGFCSFRSSIEQSLLGKLKIQGYISNAHSKQSSPARKRQAIQKSHRRNYSNLEVVSSATKLPGHHPMPYPQQQQPITSHKIEIKYQINTNSANNNNNAHTNTHSQSQANSNIAISIPMPFNKNLFEYKNVIGRGGFGKVWKVHLKRNNKMFAMKEMSKALIISKKSVPSVMNQKKLLTNLKNPFLVNMIQTFQDRQTLYLVMDYLPGGDLRYHIGKRRKFSEQEAKFLMVCIFLGLKYLHQKNIIHRDIKPENIVLDEFGYARITDLGVARTYRSINANDTSGTPGYMAPQVLCRQNHSFESDYFALGVIGYQLMLRRRPYNGRNRKEIRDQILAKQVQVKKHQIPESWSLESADFINRLLLRKCTDRLGSKGARQVAEHPWLRNFPLDKVYQKKIQAPYLPKIQLIENDWNDNNISSECTEIKELIAQNQIILRNDQAQELFQGYESHQH